jgi:predicted metal-dependent peptidase
MDKELYKELVEHPIMLMLRVYDIDGFMLTRMDVEVVKTLPKLVGGSGTNTPNSNSDITTAALMFSGGRFKIIVCEEFMAKLPMESRIAILKHEVGHFVRKHLSRRNGRDPEMWNIAADMAINQDLEDLPSGLVVVPQGWPEHTSAEAYYDLVRKNSKKQGGGGGVGNQFGNSFDIMIDTGADTNEADSMAKELIEDVVREQLQRDPTGSKFRGLHEGLFQSLIEELTKPPIADWKHEIIKFPSSIIQEQKRYTLKRPDRRGMYPFGKRKEYLPSLCACIDSSGSVSDPMLESFFSQVKHLSFMVNEVWVVVADAAVQEAFLYRPGLEEKLKKAAKGRGGTYFDPAIAYINKELKHLDGVIYLTDGWCPAPKIKCKLPVLWVVTDNKQFKARPMVIAEDKGEKRRRW